MLKTKHKCDLSDPAKIRFMNKSLFPLTILGCLLFQVSFAQITAPFTESFTTQGLPSGWTNTNFSGSTNTNALWDWGNASTNSPGYNLSNAADHTPGGGGFYAWSDGSTPVEKEVILTTDSIDVSSLTAPWLEFYLMSNNNITPGDNNTFYVDFYDGTTWNDSIYGRAGDDPNWLHVELDLSTYTISGKIMIRFTVDQTTATTAYRNDILLDDITVREKPTCPRPSNLLASNVTSTTVDLAWTTGGATNWEIEYGVPGFTVGSGTRVVTSTNPYTLTLLAPKSTYDVWLRDSCGTADVSDWIGPVNFTTLCASQMSGTYTINPLLPTAGVNFSSFSDLATQLNGCGIGGPVLVNVSSGTYTDKFALNSIPGTNAINTITIDGGTASVTTLTYVTSNDTPTVYLNGADRITFQNMTIENTGTVDAWAVGLRNQANYNSFLNCNINVPVTTSADVAGIIASNSISSPDATGDNTNYLTVDSCVFNGGEKGIRLQASSSNFGVSNHITNCIFNIQDDDGLECDFQDSLIISNNTISGSTSNAYIALDLSDIDNFEISLNNITSPHRGIIIEDVNLGATPANNSLIVNNMISSQAGDGVWSDDIEYVSIYHNTIWAVTAFRTNDQVSLDIRNNIFTSTSGLAFQSSDALGTSDSLNYNIYNTNATNMVSVGGTNYVDLPTWQVALPSYNKNSLEGDPIFSSSTDLHVQGHLANDTGDSTVGVVVDIDGDSRPLAPSTRLDIGADEFHPLFCVRPSGISAAHISDTGAVLSWATGSSSTTWAYEYGPTGFTQGTGTAGFTSNNPDTLTGLIAGLTYDFYLRDSCSDGSLSSWTGPISFKTLCNVSPITLPFNDGFESYFGTYQSAAFFCGSNYRWDYTSTNSTGRLRFNAGSGFYQNGSSAVTFDRTSGGTITNYFTLTMDMTNYIGQAGVILGFSHMHHGEENHANDRVWVRGNDTAAWIQVYNLYANQGGSGSYNTISIANGLNLSNALFNANQDFTSSFQVRFGQQDNSAASSLTGVDGRSFDDIVIDQLLCVPSASLLVHSVTMDSALVSWSGGSGTSWAIEYGPSGFTQGSGGIITSSSNDSLWLAGLTAGTIYDFYVQDTCTGGLGSLWSSSASFTTLCNITPITLPFLEDFESYNGTHSDNTFLCNSPIQLNYQRSANGGRLRFDAGSNFYLNGNHAATLDRSTGGTIINYLIFNMDMSNYKDSLGILMSFNHMHHGEENHGNDRVWIRESDTASWIQVYNLFANQGSSGNYNNVVGIDAIDLSAQLLNSNQNFTSSFQVRFGQQDNSSANSITGVDGRTFDDINFYQVPCADPIWLSASNFTSTSADLSWNSNGDSWNIQYGPLGFTQGTQTTNGTTVNGITTNPYTLTGLSPNTWYDYYVQSNCGPNISYWIGPFSFKTPCLASLSGTYTIGGPTGPNNFADFDSVAAVLNGCGISGPVTFNVQAGVYAENLWLDTVSGASAINTITFDGGNASATSITHVSSSDIPTVYLNGTDWVSFKNMTIENTGTTDAWAVFLRNQADHNSFINCEFVLPVTTSTDVAGIVASNSLSTSNSSGNNSNYLSVDQCTFTGGEKGIRLNGQNSDFSQNNSITNSIFNTQDDDAIECDFQDSLIISNNIISGSPSSNYIALDLSDIDNFEISGNEINSPDRGIIIEDVNLLAVPSVNSKILNNMISCPADDGIWADDVEYIDVYHNSVLGVPAFRINDQVNLDIRNNIFTSPTGYALESNDSLNINDKLNYNLYNSGGTNLARVSGNDYINLPAFQLAFPTYNPSSVEGDPIFFSTTNLHLLGTLANDVGDNSVNIAIDIDGDSRPISPSTTVDIGADEYTPLSNDISAFAILEPINNVCGNSNTVVKVVIRNLGANGASGFGVSANITGPVTTNLTVPYPGTLNSLQQDTVTLSSFNSTAGGVYSITASVNLIGDQDLSNDSLQTAISIINVLTPVPTAAVDTICSGQYDTLYFPVNLASASFEWKTTTGTVLGNSDSLVLGPLGNNDTTLILASISKVPYNAGPIDNSIGTGGNFTDAGVQQLYFTALKTMTIDSMAVYPNGAGNVVVNLYNSGGATAIQTTSYAVPASAAGVKTMIPIGFTVPAGNYELDGASSTTGGLYRNNAGANYPYSVPGIIDITGVSFSNANYYYYFYDWKISTGGCARPDGSITIYNGGSSVIASFTSVLGTATLSNLPVTFNASTSSVGTSYQWNFGDGNTGSGISPVHNYTTNGTYTVQLVVSNSCGTDTITNTVIIQGISLEESVLSQTLRLYPNPTSDLVNLSFKTADSDMIHIRLLDLSGRLVSSTKEVHVNGYFEEQIDLRNLADGTYILEIQSGDQKVRKRITKQ